MHELILHGGRLIDPAQDIDATHDIAFSEGKVAAVAVQIDGPAKEERDVADRRIFGPR